MRIVAYCRVSTEKEQQLESLKNQRDFFNDFAKKYNHELVEIYADEGISGKQMENRIEFLRMLEDSKRDIFDMVVVKDISRFARNTVDFLTAVRELKRRGIDVQFLSSNQTILGNSEFILTIFSAMAQEESANLSGRVKFGKKVNAKKGRVPNIIYGYDKLDTFTLVINESEAQVVRRMFDLYCKDGFGTRKISAILNDEKIPSKKGSDWSPKSIRRILANPIYTGILINNKIETVDFLTGKKRILSEKDNFVHMRPELRIISDDDFKKAKSLLMERRAKYNTSSPGRYSNKHLFSTLIKCLDCGYSFTRKVYKYKNTYVRWRCSGSNLYSGNFCKNSTVVDENVLFYKIRSYFIDAISDKQSFIHNLFAEYQRNYQSKICDISALENQQDRNNMLKQKYKEMFANNLIDLSELKEKLIETDIKNNQIKARILENKYYLSNIENVITEEREKVSDIMQLFDFEILTNSDMRKLINNISVNKEGEIYINIKSSSLL